MTQEAIDTCYTCKKHLHLGDTVTQTTLGQFHCFACTTPAERIDLLLADERQMKKLWKHVLDCGPTEADERWSALLHRRTQGTIKLRAKEIVLA
jgi:hypothetical protein